MSVASVGQNTVPQQGGSGSVFDAALNSAWKNEWTRREEARDQAKASGNEALAQHFQNELDVLKLMMPEGVPSGATPPPVRASESEPAKSPVTDTATLAATPGAPPAERPKDAPAGNTLNFTNERDTPMTIVFTANANQPAIPSITLQPGESLAQAFPEGWSGNFRSTTGDGANATLGEVAFNGGADGKQTFYDVSYIEGNNARMTIEPSAGGPVSGTLKDIVSGAPDSIKARDDQGNVYGLKKTTNAEVINDSVVSYYRSAVGDGQGYVVPKDDSSTLGSQSNSLNVRIA
ncbi:hypothetical protein BFW87_25685 [Pseudomonas fluorescens]|uniref:Uncharacterized protein n=1 Tax=Pseudomonas fluorescens TaxID=294 RepID=A0A1T2Y270_PSEFL|nr:thaumatin family protein [Pseudomonas fluorescens]OPA86142.1 hypothetical protein BFW87_25685 [Pseudomonas fluorescens]